MIINFLVGFIALILGAYALVTFPPFAAIAIAQNDEDEHLHKILLPGVFCWLCAIGIGIFFLFYELCITIGRIILKCL